MIDQSHEHNPSPFDDNAITDILLLVLHRIAKLSVTEDGISGLYRHVLQPLLICGYSSHCISRWHVENEEMHQLVKGALTPYHCWQLVSEPTRRCAKWQREKHNLGGDKNTYTDLQFGQNLPEFRVPCFPMCKALACQLK